MRARLASPRRPSMARGRIMVTAAAAAVALVGGVVVATPDTPVVRDSVASVAFSIPAVNAGVSFSYNVPELVAQAGYAGATITAIDGLPAGVTYDATTGQLSGTVTQSGTYTVTAKGTFSGVPFTLPVTVTINNADGTPPAADGTVGGGVTAGSNAQGSLGQAGVDGQAGGHGQITTGSDAADGVLGAVAGIVASLTGGSGSSGTANGEGTGTGNGGGR